MNDAGSFKPFNAIIQMNLLIKIHLKKKKRLFSLDVIFNKFFSLIFVLTLFEEGDKFADKR